MANYKSIVEKLATLLDQRSDLKEALRSSIKKAGIPEVANLTEYYAFLIRLVTEIPNRREMSPDTDKFHFLIAQSPGNILKKDPAFRQWLIEFSQNHGAFLDTTFSAGALDGFIKDPAYRIEEYDPGLGGWLTFNQFFTRHTRPGKRPIAERCNDNVIVSPTDSIFKGCWAIDERSTMRAKDLTYSIPDLLSGSPYEHKFHGGLFTHGYLDTNDYHRFHVPVGGTIRELRKIPGDVIVNTVRADDGSLTTLSEVGFQFGQTRGLVIMESTVGFVALLPIGMGHVSSVSLTAEEGMRLDKGEEFGYFAYGGSDMVMLFEADRVKFTANSGTHYKQGEKIAVATG